MTHQGYAADRRDGRGADRRRRHHRRRFAHAAGRLRRLRPEQLGRLPDGGRQRRRQAGLHRPGLGVRQGRGPDEGALRHRRRGGQLRRQRVAGDRRRLRASGRRRQLGGAGRRRPRRAEDDAGRRPGAEGDDARRRRGQPAGRLRQPDRRREGQAHRHRHRGTVPGARARRDAPTAAPASPAARRPTPWRAAATRRRPWREAFLAGGRRADFALQNAGGVRQPVEGRHADDEHRVHAAAVHQRASSSWR
ncbi:MAG: hypothetical protein MZW92_57390 [Comamonadaceae bacterium]|nr:hypothetical protein [Comamonadaceae bacterium]